MPFLRRWKTFVFIVKKVSFISRTSLNLIFSPFLTENKFKTLHFFDQKQGLTPLEKCRFWDLKKFHFYSPKQFLFYLKLYWALFLVSFWPNLNTEKFGIFFYQKHGLTSLEYAIFKRLKNFVLMDKKSFFFI